MAPAPHAIPQHLFAAGSINQVCNQLDSKCIPCMARAAAGIVRPRLMHIQQAFACELCCNDFTRSLRRCALPHCLHAACSSGNGSSALQGWCRLAPACAAQPRQSQAFYPTNTRRASSFAGCSRGQQGPKEALSATARRSCCGVTEEERHRQQRPGAQTAHPRPAPLSRAAAALNQQPLRGVLRIEGPKKVHALGGLHRVHPDSTVQAGMHLLGVRQSCHGAPDVLMRVAQPPRSAKRPEALVHVVEAQAAMG
jgi:hypothetical protein